MQIDHIYWFAYFNRSEPSVRYRAEYVLAYLKAAQSIGYSLVCPGYAPANLLHFVRTYLSALLFRKPNSIIVFQKIYTNGIYATALKLLLFFRPRYTQYDIDDAEYLRRPAGTLRHFMKRCATCSAGSAALVGYIESLNGRAFLLSSPVIDHGLFKMEREQPLTIGWIGYYGAHRENLMHLFFPAIRTLGFPIRLSLLGVRGLAEEQEIRNYFLSCPNVSLDLPRSIDWLDEPAVYRCITRFDLAVSPLLDTAFNHGKSAFKLKQCLSCGVPVLASRVGENKRFLHDGENGFFCDTPEAFAERIRFFQQLDPADYRQFSRNARNTFPAFSVEAYCSTLMAHWQQWD